MTAIYLLLAAGFLLPLGSIGLDAALDNAGQRPLFLRQPRRVRIQQAEVAELQRLLPADLPPERESLLPVDFYDTWPQRQTPSDLPARLGMVIAEDTGRHHVGVAPGTSEQQARWNSPTGQFWAIVGALGDLSEPCTHCATPEDGEPAHVGCPGCACPCTLVEVTA